MAAPKEDTTPVTELSKAKSPGAGADNEKGGAVDSASLAVEKRRADAEGVSSAYEKKVYLVNKVISEDIGMGKFQWELFALSGFGWFVDNVWLQGVAIVLPQVQKEFKPEHVEYMTLALYSGLICGAATWGILADIVGRRLSFNMTLFLAGVFGIAAGGAPNFVALGGLLAALGFGVGGNLPVDGALFLEFIPGASQFLLTFLSVFWSLGQLFASLIAWAFISNYSCDPDNALPASAPCPRSTNMGWRYTYFCLGSITFIMFILRFFVFRLPESPKYLISKGRDAEAVEVLKEVARRNNIELNTISVESLRAAAGEDVDPLDDDHARPAVSEKANMGSVQMNLANVKRTLSKFDLSHVKPLFATPKLAWNSFVIILLWGMIGLAYPLFNAFITLYLSHKGTNTGYATVYDTFKNYTIISVCGVPGSFIAAWLVELPRSGRRGAMAISTLLTGVFLYAFIYSKTAAQVLAFSCVTALTENAMYGVLYGYTPEAWPAPVRGTGDGLASSFNRITGILAPGIKIVLAKNPAQVNTPLFVAASLFVASAVLMCMLRIETQGRSAL